MRTVEIYTIVAVLDIIVLIANLVAIGVKYKDSNISMAIGGSAKIVDKMLIRIVGLYYSKGMWDKSILGVLVALPVINLVVLTLLLNGVLPKQAELVLDYSKDDWKIEIYQYSNVNFAIVNDEFKHKALVTEEALEYLLNLPENKIKFYLSIFKVCISEAMSENNYKIIMIMTQKGLSFEKIESSKK